MGTVRRPPGDQAGGDFGIGRVNIDAFVGHDLLDDPARFDQLFRQHFPPAAGADQQKPLAGGARRQRFRERLRPEFVGYHVSLQVIPR